MPHSCGSIDQAIRDIQECVGILEQVELVTSSEIKNINWYSDRAQDNLEIVRGINEDLRELAREYASTINQLESTEDALEEEIDNLKDHIAELKNDLREERIDKLHMEYVS